MAQSIKGQNIKKKFDKEDLERLKTKWEQLWTSAKKMFI
jgi:hypothetical protein